MINFILSTIFQSSPYNEWKSPPHGSYKANWDVALSLGQKSISIGMIVRDYKGYMCAAMSQTREGYPN